MDAIRIKSYSPEKQGGGNKAAALFWLACLVPLLLSFVLSETLFGQGDSTLRYAPRGAAAYVHARGTESVGLLRGFTGALPPVSPDEAAIFAVRNAEGELEWSSAMRWSRLDPPSKEEMAVLSEFRAAPIDGNTYIVGRGARPGDSLKDDPMAGDMLARARGAFRIQGFVRPDRLSPDTDWARTLEPVAFGLAKHGGLLRGGISTTGGNLLPSASLRGDAPASAELSVTGSPVLSMALSDGLLDPFSTLFHAVEVARQERGVPESATLQETRRALTEILSGRASFALRPSSDEGAPPSFAVYLPDATAEELQEAVAAYLSASLPRLDETELADGQIVNEFVIEPKLFEYRAGEAVPRMPVDTGTAFEQSYPTAEAGNGVVLASDRVILDEMTSAMDDSRPLDRCLSQKLPSVSISLLPELFPEGHPLRAMLKLRNIDQITVYKTGDKSLYFCE